MKPIEIWSLLKGLTSCLFSINQSINVYSFQQPHLIFQEKKAFAVATLVVSQAPKSVNMHRNFELSYIGLCDKLSISTTTLGVNSWKLTITTTSAIWTKRGTGNIVWRNLGLEGKLSELSWFPASSRWEESIDRIFMVVGWGITTPGGVGGSDWIGGCGRGNAYLIFVIFFYTGKIFGE